MMIVNTKFGVAILALFASSAVAAADGNNEQKKRTVRKLRKVKNHRQVKQLRKNRKAAVDADITEDVAFWTRHLQNGSMAPTPSTPRPTPRVTLRPNPQPTPPPTPNPTPPGATPRPTPNPTRRPSPPPVPTPTPPPVGGATPVARDDTFTMPLSDALGFIPVLDNDTPAAGQTLSVLTITNPATNGECTVSVDLTQVVYIPDGTGSDSCTYQACDTVPVCDTATVTITTTAN